MKILILSFLLFRVAQSAGVYNSTTIDLNEGNQDGEYFHPNSRPNQQCETRKIKRESKCKNCTEWITCRNVSLVLLMLLIATFFGFVFYVCLYTYNAEDEFTWANILKTLLTIKNKIF